MAESQDDPRIFWVDPEMRGIFPLEKFHISRSLSRHMRKTSHRVSLNENFHETVTACAQRDETWINETIFDLYLELHKMGHAHSIEIWQDEQLVGGMYGISLGRAFFGESMFSRCKNGSKMALAYVMPHLSKMGFTLFDTQFITPHLASLGAIEISRSEYQILLEKALANGSVDITSQPLPDIQSVLQRSTQTS